MIISVASGKGGTGKTTVSVNLALSIDNAALFDCDVEEPNAHLFLNPSIKETIPVKVLIPEIDNSKCDYCGKCKEVCAYNALAVLKNDVLVFAELCHSCGACAYFCPKQAIKEVRKEIGVVEVGESNGVEFVHGKLNIGEAKSPPLIKAVKDNIRSNKINIIDAPPGTSCPVIESVKGSDFCVLVTEPTPFGLNDLVLAVEMLRKIKIKFGVVINRAGLGDNKTEEYCSSENIPVLMRIPFSKDIASAYAVGTPIVHAFKEYKDEFKDLFDKVRRVIA